MFAAILDESSFWLYFTLVTPLALTTIDTRLFSSSGGGDWWPSEGERGVGLSIISNTTSRFLGREFFLFHITPTIISTPMNKHPPIAPEAMTTRSDLCFFIGFDSPTRCFSDVGPKLSLVGWFLLVGGGGVVVVLVVVEVVVVVVVVV